MIQSLKKAIPVRALLISYGRRFGFRRSAGALEPIAFAAAMTVAMLVAQDARAEPRPCWIWGANQEATEGPLRFTKSFHTTSPGSSSRLRFAPAFARLTISLDGKDLAVCEPDEAIQTLELDRPLSAGDHEIAVEATGVTGPSAFFLQWELQWEDATRTAIVSDSSWLVDGGGGGAGDGRARDLGPVAGRLIVPATRRVGIDVVDDYEQWKQSLGASQGADPATFQVAPGFEIRLIRSALPHEDSWVSMVFDRQGRVIIAQEKKGLLRMTLAPDGGEVISTESLDDTLEECRGLAFLGDDLFANANNSKALYRLRAKDDHFAEPEIVYASSGGVGHGRNDLAAGLDGKLYAIHGDSVDLPAEAIDDTSPFREARRGQKTSEGHLLRIDPESKRPVELLAAGLRNPFGIDFNADGELFTYDADAEYDMGAPWYRPTRVSHLVTGGDYGWRGVTQSWPPYYPDHPDNARPNLDIGKGSPTAVKFGTRSSFPAPYRDALFILDWAYGRILAVHMVPRGSSYLMAAETFVKGRPLNVTDLDFAPDGAMYLVTGGRQTQSALYRISHTGGGGGEPEAATPQGTAMEQFSKDSRRLRRNLEAELRRPPTADRLASVWKHLADPDPWIRYAAVNVIERHPTPSWQSRALTESQVTRAAHALTALARAGQRELYPAIVRRLNEILPGMESPSDKQTAFYAYGLCLESLNDIDDELRQAATVQLDALYPSESLSGPAYGQNRWLSELLVKLRSPEVISKTVRLLQVAATQAEQMQYLYVLRNLRDGWTIDSRRAYFAGLAQAEHYLGGAGMSDFLKRIREEAVETLTGDERIALGSLLLESASPIEAVVPSEPRPIVSQWTVAALLPAESDPPRGDQSRGRELFATARCQECHRFGTRGRAVGPDLTSVSRRFSRRDLLTSIVEPSQVVAENYRSLQIVTRDGKIYLGQVSPGGDYRSPVLRLSTDPARPFETIEIPKSEIESQSLSAVSWMPTGLLDTFTREEIFDLLDYLESAP